MHYNWVIWKIKLISLINKIFEKIHILYKYYELSTKTSYLYVKKLFPTFGIKKIDIVDTLFF